MSERRAMFASSLNVSIEKLIAELAPILPQLVHERAALAHLGILDS